MKTSLDNKVHKMRQNNNTKKENNTDRMNNANCHCE
jgi:hypothetical protein